jgi:membrane protease YdiL (CAAX protease family)
MHLLVLFLLSLSMMVVSVVVGAVAGPANPKSGDAWLPWLSWQALSQVLMFALPTLVVAWRYYRPGQRQWLRLDFSGSRWLLALAGVVVMLLLVPLTDWLTAWNDALHLPQALNPVEESLRRAGEQSQGMLQDMMREVNPLVSLLCVALVPAVCEELFFRAGIQNLLQRWTGNVHVAVWVTAAVFSLAHFEVFAFLPRFLLGALLGYLYVGGGSLVVNAVAHFVNNAIVVVAFWLACGHGIDIDPSAPLAVGWEVTVACSVAAIFLLVVTFGKRLKISV